MDADGLEFFIEQEISHEEMDYIHLAMHSERMADTPLYSLPDFGYNAMNNLAQNNLSYPFYGFMNQNNLGKNTGRKDYFDAGDLKFLYEFLDSNVKMDNSMPFESPDAISTSATITTTTFPTDNVVAAATPASVNATTNTTDAATDAAAKITSFVAGPERKAAMRRPPMGRFRKSALLEMEDIQKYFGMPIIQAAKEMKVGLTVLKKRYRELNITRWPHRKIKSLKTLINNVKGMGLELREIEMLEEHKKLVERLPHVELTERAKKLRQACFKDSYKKRRFMGRAR